MGYVATQPQAPPIVAVASPERGSCDRRRGVHPIRSEDRCFEVRVSEAETCWFSSRQSLLINVSLHLDFLQVQRTRGDTLGEEERENFLLEVGDVSRQVTWLVRKMDTAARR